jgi:hypothetical protein
VVNRTAELFQTLMHNGLTPRSCRLATCFNRRRASLKARTGVGVRADGKVIFAISEEAVSFDAFARLFRDALNCPNALFLDGGSASSFVRADAQSPQQHRAARPYASRIRGNWRNTSAMSHSWTGKECEQIREQAIGGQVGSACFHQMMLKWLIAAVIIYGGFVALLYLAQRSLQYFPSGVANQIVHGLQAFQEMVGT